MAFAKALAVATSIRTLRQSKTVTTLADADPQTCALRLESSVAASVFPALASWNSPVRTVLTPFWTERSKFWAAQIWNATWMIAPTRPRKAGHEANSTAALPRSSAASGEAASGPNPFGPLPRGARAAWCDRVLRHADQLPVVANAA